VTSEQLTFATDQGICWMVLNRRVANSSGAVALKAGDTITGFQAVMAGCDPELVASATVEQRHIDAVSAFLAGNPGANLTVPQGGFVFRCAPAA
jgi:hypothetical protein